MPVFFISGELGRVLALIRNVALSSQEEVSYTDMLHRTRLMCRYAWQFKSYLTSECPLDGADAATDVPHTALQTAKSEIGGAGVGLPETPTTPGKTTWSDQSSK